MTRWFQRIGGFDVITDPQVKREQLHVVPNYPGERPHDPEPSCWCNPRQDQAHESLWVHNRRAEA